MTATARSSSSGVSGQHSSVHSGLELFPPPDLVRCLEHLVAFAEPDPDVVGVVAGWKITGSRPNMRVVERQGDWTSMKARIRSASGLRQHHPSLSLRDQSVELGLLCRQSCFGVVSQAGIVSTRSSVLYFRLIPFSLCGGGTSVALQNL